jgi:hypothetical protein
MSTGIARFALERLTVGLFGLCEAAAALETGGEVGEVVGRGLGRARRGAPQFTCRMLDQDLTFRQRRTLLHLQ